MIYFYDKSKFLEHLAIMCHEQYRQQEKYRVRIDLQWGGLYSGHSQEDLNAIGFQKGQEELLRNTLGFVTEHIHILYEEMLKAMLPVFGATGVGENTEAGVVKTLEDLHNARMAMDFINTLQINLNDVKEDIGVFSLILRLRYEYDAPEDGCEFVFDHDRLLFWGDGNTGNHIYYYADEIRDGVNCEFLKTCDP